MVSYNLEQIKTMVKEGKVDSTNFRDIMKSLANHSIDDDTVRNILNELASSENVPKEYRDLLEEVLVSELYTSKVEEGTTGADSTTSSEKSEVKEASVVPQNTTVVSEETSFETMDELEDRAYIIDDSGTPVFAAVASHYNNEVMMNDISKLAAIKGIKIIDSKVGNHEPALIAMELTHESKPYLDNLLLQLYGDEKNHLNVELTKDKETGKEMLVMNVDDKDLSSGEIERYSTNMLQQVNDIITNTDKNKDYEALMSPELRKIRDKFHGDEEDVAKDNDVEFVYSKDDGVNSYHIVADSKEEAKEVADQLGVSIKEDHGGGVFEIDDSKVADMDGSKIAKASTGVNYSDEVKKINDQGVSDLDIDYNNKNYSGFTKDEATTDIIEFLKESKQDYRAISQLEIKCIGNQRVVEMRDTNGYNDTVIIHDGKEFDDNVLPIIADTFSKDTEVSGSKVYEENGSVGYFAESSENTRLIINGSSETTINQVEDTVNKNKTQIEETKTNTNTKTYEKVLGTYPTNNSQDANTSLATLVVFILVMIFGIAIIYIIFGG